MKRFYVGHIRGTIQSEVFSTDKTPTEKDYPQYAAVTGPFKTKRGACYMAKYGYNNPHLQHVNDAEHYAEIDHYRAIQKKYCKSKEAAQCYLPST